jgi:hypothetical protein
LGPEGGGPAGPGGFVPQPGGAPPGGVAPEPMPQPDPRNYIPARFAFVVQVIEGQSYPAENSKSKGE